MSANRVLRRIFGPKRDEVRVWRKLHNGELYNFHFSSSIIRKIKSKVKRCTGHVVRMGKRGTGIGYWFGSQKERDYC
jgi:hypothetical protein